MMPTVMRVLLDLIRNGDSLGLCAYRIGNQFVANCSRRTTNAIDTVYVSAHSRVTAYVSFQYLRFHAQVHK